LRAVITLHFPSRYASINHAAAEKWTARFILHSNCRCDISMSISRDAIVRGSAFLYRALSINGSERVRREYGRAVISDNGSDEVRNDPRGPSTFGKILRPKFD